MQHKIAVPRQEHHAESAHLLFPEIEIIIFFLDLFESFNVLLDLNTSAHCIASDTTKSILSLKIWSCGTALHAFTHVLFFLQLFHAATITPQNKNIDSTTVSSLPLLVLHWYYLSSSYRAGLSLLGMK